jgi:hypothetical protein
VQAVWVVVVVLVVLVAHAVHLARSLAQTRVRLLSLERFVEVLARTGDLEAKRAAERRAADLERLAAVELAQAQSATEHADDEACTKVWTGPPAALVEAAARGANPSSQATPRAARAVDVAPRAVASPPPLSSAAPPPTPRAFLSLDVAPRAATTPPRLSRAAQLAAGLERPKSTRTPTHAPPVRVRTETLAGMPASLPPAGPAPVVAVPRFAPTLVSMQAQSAAPHEPPTRRDAVAVGPRTASRPSDDDGETTSALASGPPMYAARKALSASTREPLADPDLIGSEDQAEEAGRHRLGADEPTPRQARVKVEA